MPVQMQGYKKVLENVFLANRPISCKKCNGKLFYLGGGKYKCHPLRTLLPALFQRGIWRNYGIVP